MTIRKVTFILTTAVVCVLMTSCGSTRQIVYMQGADSAYVLPKQIPQQFELKVQPDDQLAITIATKTKESLRPFVNTYLMGSGDNTMGTSSTANVSGGCHLLYC
jgi:polysaccharide export outer membrane protein